MCRYRRSVNTATVTNWPPNASVVSTRRTFREDQCRVRQGNTDINLSLIRRLALTLLRNERTAKAGVKTKHISAALDENYLTKVLLVA
ncbi:MAG: hypothetical protein O2983_06405 [Planctomycetota bacterium]|nr:hypothetical protein [Planctomycetota bacterium]